MNKWLACALVALTSGCPDVKTDANETAADPIVEFDPSKSIVPFPNNLLINPMTGKVNLPAGCNETASTKALREGVLNNLDGFGTFETAISVTLTKPIDAAQLTNDAQFVADHFLLYKSTDPAAPAIPLAVLPPGTSIRYTSQTKNADGTLTCMDPKPIDAITLVPKVPLEQKTTYIVALKSGLKTAEGEDYVASFTWSLVRQDTNPVTVDDAGNVIADRTPLDPSTPAGLASLQGINLLWNAHKPVLDFLTGAKGHNRDDILLAWSFKTQTTQDALDTSVAGTPAASLNNMPLTGPIDGGPAVPISIIASKVNVNTRTVYPFLVCNTGVGLIPPETNDTQCFLKMTLGTFGPQGTPGIACQNQADCEAAYQSGTQNCAFAACSAIADVMAARLRSAQYQIDLPNAAVPAKPIPGPWMDPVKPTKVKEALIPALIIVPSSGAPTNGFPTAIFQHGLGQNSTNIFAIGGRLANAPSGDAFMTIAIDAVAHGDRAVQNSNDAAKGCSGIVTAGRAPQCFAGFLSPDLGTTRDNIRQTNVDHMQLAAALKACGNTNCGTFKVDPTHIVYIGQSLGGILGGTSVAMSPDIKAGVLNVPGVGWADIFENTQTLAIRCTLVDGLIDAGTLVGEKSNLAAMPPTGLCTTDAWKDQPGYRQFAAIGRWVLDPGDPANYVQRLIGNMGTKKFLLQEVVGDTVVPNLATENEAALTGRMSSPANENTSGITPVESDAIKNNPTQSKFVKYATLPPVAGVSPGNTFNHGSLLRPAPTVGSGSCNLSTGQNCDGILGSAQMIIDAVTFLKNNK